MLRDDVVLMSEETWLEVLLSLATVLLTHETEHF